MLHIKKLLLIYLLAFSTPALSLNLKSLLISPIVASAFHLNPHMQSSRSDILNKYSQLGSSRTQQNDFFSFSFQDNEQVRFVNFHGSQLIVGIHHHTPFDELFASISLSSDPRYTIWDSENKWIISFEYAKKLSIFEIRSILDALKFDSFIDHKTHESCLKRII